MAESNDLQVTKERMEMLVLNKWGNVANEDHIQIKGDRIKITSSCLTSGTSFSLHIKERTIALIRANVDINKPTLRFGKWAKTTGLLS
jgi:hypothetical protein